MTLTTHPAAELLPMLSEEELKSLADDILNNGLIEPVILFNGEVLDGRNRLKACEMAGVTPEFIEMSGSIFSPVMYVVSRNIRRRHLTISQRGAIAAEMVPLLAEEAKKRQGRRTDLEQDNGTCAPIGADVGRATEQAAQAVGVGGRTVQRAVKIMNESPEMFEKVKSGEVSAYTAEEAIDKPTEAVLERVQVNGGARSKQISQAAKNRMVDSLSTITGCCRGLEKLDIKQVLFACDDEEVSIWAEKSKELAKTLRGFAAQLENK